MLRLRSVVASLVVLLLGAVSVRAQPAEPALLRGESPQTRKRLAEAEQKVLGGKAADAVEELQRILDEAADDLISLDGKHHRPARWVAHQILAKLPADVLKTYRDRIDEPARKLLDAGKRDRDPRPLWQLLDRYFVSRQGEEASLLLGDLLFERGDFRTAEMIWKRLLPDADADVNYPDVKTDPATVRARMILAAIFQGETDRAKKDLTAFKAKHPEAKGNFAGKNGPYAETLQAFLDRPPQPVPMAIGDRTWPTFGGDPSRTGRIHGPLPVHWSPRPTWTASIHADKLALIGKALSAPARPPFGHPVVLNGWVYVSDGNRVMAFELTSGNAKTVYSPFPADAPEPKSTDPIVSPSLTAAHGRLYARLGSPAMRTPEPMKPSGKKEESALVCFAPVAKPGQNSPPLRELWRIPPPLFEGKPLGVWEGAPLVANGRMWAAFARFEGGRVVHGVAGYDPADADTAPDRPAWTVEVCDSPVLSNPEVQARARQELLTLAGRNIVFCSNSGAVIALDAATGHRAWAVQYSRAAHRLVEANRLPDPAPAVVHDGRVFVAPADADRVLALDAETGQELWESGRAEGAQIVGVSRNRVIVTTTGPVLGIRGLSVADGSYRAPDGWIQANGLLGYGHGIVCDDAIIWPSRAGLLFLDPESGLPIVDALRWKETARNESPFGNLAFADGWLVVVTPTEVWGYQSDSPPYVRPPTPRHRFQTTIDRAERDLANGNLPAAREALAKAAHDDFPRAWRAWAAARLLLLTPPTDDVRKLPPEVRDALAPELLGEWLLTAEGELLSLGSLVDRRSGKPLPARGSPTAPTLPADRKPLDAPSLDSDARIASTLRLPLGSVPLRPIRGALSCQHAFVAAPRDLFAASLAEETKTLHAPAGEFTHAADLAEGFLAAGPLVVALYDGDREPLWVFRVPETDSLPNIRGRTAIRIDQPERLPELSSFALAGDWLIARLGEHHLIALDLKARSVAWILGTHGRSRFEPRLFPTAPTFTPNFYFSEHLLEVQLSDGRRWRVPMSTGQPPSANFGTKTSAVPWSMPPVEVEGNRLAFPDGPGLVRFSNRTSGRAKFAYQAEGGTSLAGDPPQVRRWGEVLLVAVRRNYGVELDRIEPTDGKSAWTAGAVFLDASRIDLTAADADPQRVFIVAGNKLLAIELDEGKTAWEVDLPRAAQWIVRAGRKIVIAYPAEAIPDQPFDAAWNRVCDSFLKCPQPWRLPWLATSLYDCWTDRTVPVLLFDSETGKLVKRLTVPAHGPSVMAWFEGDHAVIATGDRVCWLK